jgi:hypothetical protein
MSAITKLDKALATEEELKATLQVDVRHRNMMMLFVVFVVGVLAASLAVDSWLGVMVGGLGFMEVGGLCLTANQQVAKTKIRLLKAQKASRLLSVGIAGGDE